MRKTMSAAEESVAAAQRAAWEAANRGDTSTLEGLLDDDFVLVEADTLERKDKAGFLAEISERSEDERLVSFELVNVKVQMAGDMAVVYAQVRCEDEVDGERLEMGGNAVDVFLRRGGEWKLAGSVYGEVPSYDEG